MVVRTHRVGLKLLLRELGHGQVVLGVNADLNMAHISAGLGFEDRWMVVNLNLRMGELAAASLDADELRVELVVAYLLVRAKLMRILQTGSILLSTDIGGIRLVFRIIIVLGEQCSSFVQN